VKRLVVLGGVLASGLALGGCGFTPLYAAPGVVPNLAAVDVIAPQGRTGFLLREHLDDALAKNRSAPVRYTMRLSIGEARYPRGIRTDNTATRYEYILTADYTLANAPAGDIAKRGKVRVEITYDSADQPYASIMAQQDAEDRAAEEAAHRIEIEVAAWMATGEPKTGAAKKAATPVIEPPPANEFTAPASPASGTPKKG
jgi:LPS-assembly lipoprotein